MKVFSKGQDFLELFDKVGANITQAATILVAIMEHFTNLDNWAKEVHELEEDGDMLTHDIIKKLNKTFVTPFDREDIHALASKLVWFRKEPNLMWFQGPGETLDTQARVLAWLAERGLLYA